uniref:TNFR-Cys domain-containing protein n=1 Tax=Oryzias latipes TaxID=8090 RepID=A0A3P9KKR6_ORYLA
MPQTPNQCKKKVSLVFVSCCLLLPDCKMLLAFFSSSSFRSSGGTYSELPGTQIGCPDRWSCWLCKDTAQHMTLVHGCRPQCSCRDSTEKQRKSPCYRTDSFGVPLRNAEQTTQSHKYVHSLNHCEVQLAGLVFLNVPVFLIGSS